MGITINKSVFSDNGFKNREAANLLKEKIIFYISKVINEENVPVDFTSASDVPEDFQAVA